MERRHPYEQFADEVEARCDGSPENNVILPINSIFSRDGISDFFDCKRNIKNWEIVKVMCNHGARIDLNNEIGTNLLHSLCKRGCLEDVLFTVNYGADLFSRQNGSSTLHKAVLTYNFDLVDFLLTCGVYINEKNHLDDTPLHLLAKLSDTCYRVTGNRSDCMEKEYVDMIEFLVDNGADVNALDHYCYTPLANSLYLNFLDISECFLELEAKLNLQMAYDFFCGYNYAESIPKKCLILELLFSFSTMKKIDISQQSNKISYPMKFLWAKPFYQKCMNQLNEMKRRNICQSRNISFFDFLSNDLMEVAVYCSSEEIMLVFESGEYKKEFPYFEFLLKKRVERVQLLKNYLNLLTHFLEEFFNKELTIVVLDVIFSFLSAGDVRNFARALRITKDFPNGNYCMEYNTCM